MYVCYTPPGPAMTPAASPQVLAQHPGVFHHYEPLSQRGVRQIRSGREAFQAQQLIHRLLDCRFQVGGLIGQRFFLHEISDAFNTILVVRWVRAIGWELYDEIEMIFFYR